jgi:calcineurin-like phosphoesterase family protein
MAETYFIGDTHFGHKKMPELRCFFSLEEHDETLIENWNSVVRKQDVVYVLGDFAFGAAVVHSVAPRLRGDKRLILGNHDLHATKVYSAYFNKLYGAMPFGDGIVTHIPVHESQLDRYAFNIHGHLHTHRVMQTSTRGATTLKEPDPRYQCVSAERLALRPISWHNLSKRMAQERKDAWISETRNG